MKKQTKLLLATVAIDVLVIWNLIYFGIVKEVYIVDYLAYGILTIITVVAFLGFLAIVVMIKNMKASHIEEMIDKGYEGEPTGRKIYNTITTIGESAVIVFFGNSFFGILYLIALGLLLSTTWRLSDIVEEYKRLKSIDN